MYKFIKEEDGVVKTLICAEEESNLESMLEAFQYFLMANGFVFDVNEHIVVYNYEEIKEPIGTWPDEVKDNDE